MVKVVLLWCLWGGGLSLSSLCLAQYQVALVDRFYPGDAYFGSEDERTDHGWLHGLVDIDRDRVREPLYHGDLVSRVLAHPDIHIHPYALPEGVLPLVGILAKLNQLHRDVAEGLQLDAVLLPWESSTLLMAFDLPLAKHRVDDYLARVKAWGESNPTWAITYDIIVRLETIVEAGVPVFTIAGNGGARMVNTYTFARGVTAVGNDNPELKHFIADNVFVDLRAKAHYSLERVDDIWGKPLGYDMTGDRCPDISLNTLSSQGDIEARLPRRHGKQLVGSSFAAPAALRQYLLGPEPAPVCERTLLSQLDGLN